MKVREVALGGMIAALYAAATLLFVPISFGAVQLRIAEALTLLPFFNRAAIPGLFVGCVIANFIGGFGVWDVVFGSAATLSAAWLSARMPNIWFAAVPPVVINMFVVGAMLHLLIEVPFWPTVVYVGLGQAAACFGIGIPLMSFLKKRGFI